MHVYLVHIILKISGSYFFIFLWFSFTILCVIVFFVHILSFSVDFTVLQIEEIFQVISTVSGILQKCKGVKCETLRKLLRLVNIHIL